MQLKGVRQRLPVSDEEVHRIVRQELNKSLEDYARAHVQALEDITADGKPSNAIRNLRESMCLSGLYHKHKVEHKLQDILKRAGVNTVSQACESHVGKMYKAQKCEEVKATKRASVEGEKRAGESRGEKREERSEERGGEGLEERKGEVKTIKRAREEGGHREGGNRGEKGVGGRQGDVAPKKQKMNDNSDTATRGGKERGVKDSGGKESLKRGKVHRERESGAARAKKEVTEKFWYVSA